MNEGSEEPEFLKGRIELIYNVKKNVILSKGDRRYLESLLRPRGICF